jgi:hypothetical protein
MVNPYSVKEIGRGWWQVFLHETPVGRCTSIFNDAKLLCDDFNKSFETAYQLGYDAGFNSSVQFVVNS